MAWIHKMARIMRQNPESLNRDCVSWQWLHSPCYRRNKITDNRRETCILISRAINKELQTFKNSSLHFSFSTKHFLHHQIITFVKSQSIYYLISTKSNIKREPNAIDEYQYIINTYAYRKLIPAKQPRA